MMDVLENINLILIPDYLSVNSIEGADSAALIVGDATKVPGQYQNVDKFIDVRPAENRSRIMEMVPKIQKCMVMSPSLAYYRRVWELRDDCFFADLTQRLVAGGSYVEIHSGLMREKVPRMAKEWLADLGADGIKIIYEVAPIRPSAVSTRELITAADVVTASKQGITEIVTAPRAIITPGAWDEAKERHVIILTSSGGRS